MHISVQLINQGQCAKTYTVPSGLSGQVLRGQSNVIIKASQHVFNAYSLIAQPKDHLSSVANQIK